MRHNSQDRRGGIQCAAACRFVVPSSPSFITTARVSRILHTYANLISRAYNEVFLRKNPAVGSICDHTCTAGPRFPGICGVF